MTFDPAGEVAGRAFEVAADIEADTPIAAGVWAARMNDDGICWYCAKDTQGNAGDPGKWPLLLPVDEKQPGTGQVVHMGCVMARMDRVRVLEEELKWTRTWFCCPSCGEDHPDNTMCPPHEVRTTGQAWFRERIRKMEGGIKALEAALKEKP